MPEIVKATGEDGDLEPVTATAIAPVVPDEEADPLAEAVAAARAEVETAAAVVETEEAKETEETPVVEAPIVEIDESAATHAALDSDPWGEIEALDSTWEEQVAALDATIEAAAAYEDRKTPVAGEDLDLLTRWAEETNTVLRPPTGAEPTAATAPVVVPAPEVPAPDPNNVMGFMTEMRESMLAVQRTLTSERADRAEEKKRLLTDQRKEKVKRQKAQFSSAALALGAPEDVHDLLFEQAIKLRDERPTLKEKPVKEVLGVLKEKYPSLWTGAVIALAADPAAGEPVTPARTGEPLKPRAKKKRPPGDRPPSRRKKGSAYEPPPTSLNEAASAFKRRANEEL